MNDKPMLILDAHWRQINELFSAGDLQKLRELFDVIWARDEPIPADVLEESLPHATVLIAAEPHIDEQSLSVANNLKCVIEVSGAFPSTIDYAACVRHNVQVLSCAPGFQQSVAEMTLGMALAGARGLVDEHERFRHGKERWLNDNSDSDFSLFGCTIGFVGYGSIARATHRLLQPFGAEVFAYDPWLNVQQAAVCGIALKTLDDLMSSCRLVFVMASPSKNNYQMINATQLANLQDGALLVVVSRAHLVDFDAIVEATKTGRFRAAIDVFPTEPLAADHSARRNQHLILSPHRAAAVDKGRQLIGTMILHDMHNLLKAHPDRQLQIAEPARIAEFAGVGNSTQVSTMALERG
ncbi:MAG: NAD(P)-dependent oxidoreductase [Granulosicoccus sp.]